MTESPGCTILRLLQLAFRCREPPAAPPRPRIVVVGFGKPLGPDQPNPTELEIMAIGNVGQRIPLIAKFLQADGTTPATVDGPPVWSTDDPTIAEVRGEPPFVYLLAEGSTAVNLKVDADRTAGVRELTAVGLVVVNDPATEAQTVELELGAAEDVPAEPMFGGGPGR